MGATKSFTHMYSWNEYLYYYIQRGQISKVQEVLQKKPNLIKEPLTHNSKITALYRAAYLGNLQLVKVLVQKYNADVNLQTPIGETPLIGAIKKNKREIVQYLVNKGADINFLATTSLSVIQYAILPGYYDIALYLYEKIKDKQLRSAGEYNSLARTYKYRYVNYFLFLHQLRDMIRPQNARDFLTKEKKRLSDPVIDPRQTWKQWFVRNLQFKDPPLCQRAQLPQDLQPQNRQFGKTRHFFTKLTISKLSQQPNFQPSKQVQSQMHEVHESSKNSIQINKFSERMQTQTVS